MAAVVVATVCEDKAWAPVYVAAWTMVVTSSVAHLHWLAMQPKRVPNCILHLLSSQQPGCAS